MTLHCIALHYQEPERAESFTTDVALVARIAMAEVKVKDAGAESNPSRPRSRSPRTRPKAMPAGLQLQQETQQIEYEGQTMSMPTQIYGFCAKCNVKTQAFCMSCRQWRCTQSYTTMGFSYEAQCQGVKCPCGADMQYIENTAHSAARSLERVQSN